MSRTIREAYAGVSDQLKDLANRAADISCEEDVKTIKNDLEKVTRKIDVLESDVRLRSEEERNEYPTWRSELKAFRNQVKKIQVELKWNGKDGDQDGAEVKLETEEQAIGHGQELMKEIDRSAKNILSNIDKAEKLGTKTAAKLSTQGDQLAQVDRNLKETDESLTRSGNIIKRMMRRL
eukprot:TRINITY_DN8742_c0_g1_i1.p1 TRINITY_DN8742_c0_g1~~TRINITY_DN8742_c0_g1_i1.p1  ORF type:complete len:179 (-),score=52.15 TRINITY_DN8742_c0_g1_i1:38-574(-)